MKTRNGKKTVRSRQSGIQSRRGFSLLEMIFVVVILTVVMGVVFQQLILVQKRSKTEDTKLDLTQESREFLDQIVRDLHSIGYPTQRMYATGGIATTPATNDPKVAVGLVKIAYDELWFEGDVDGSGTVWVVDYKLQADASGKCPCRISRSQVQKITGNPYTGQNPVVYSMELTDVINSGGAGGNATGVPKYPITGGSAGGSNDTLFTNYKNANVFSFYDETGAEITTPSDYSTSTGQSNLSKVRAIRININVLGRQLDMQTGRPPVMSFTVGVRTPNQ